jgi:carboxyl-terminal processing protease
MPRRNIFILIIVIATTLACHIRADRVGRILVHAMDEIEWRYLEPVDREILFEGAVEGMFRQLEKQYKDEFSFYIPSQHQKDFQQILSQKYGGIGIHIRLIDDKTDPDQPPKLTVFYPLVGSPAYLVGIKPGDTILKIDGQSTFGMTLAEASKMLKGPLDETVKLTVLHPGKTKSVQIPIRRQQITVGTVLGDTRKPEGTWNFRLENRPEIGYLRISSFSEKTLDEVKMALEQILGDGQDLKGIVIDLRNDPGGYLDVAVGVCDLFVDSGTIVSTRRRDGEIAQIFHATEEDTIADIPIAVLINQDSASASEIVAACLQDHKRATIVGQRTFGKGTVQELLKLEGDRGILKLTAASYWRPNGKNIHRLKDATTEDDWGVSPDSGFEVVISEEELADWINNRIERDLFNPASENGKAPLPDAPRAALHDPQLDRALKVF